MGGHGPWPSLGAAPVAYAENHFCDVSPILMTKVFGTSFTIIHLTLRDTSSEHSVLQYLLHIWYEWANSLGLN